MASQKQKVYAGFFIFLAIALLLTTVAVIERRFDKGERIFKLVFPEDMSVTGLSKGSTVKYKGVPVGKVGEITLEQEDGSAPHAVAMLFIEDAYAQHARDPRVRAELVLQGLSGSLGIDLFISKEDTQAPREPPEESDQDDPPVIHAEESGLSEILTNTPVLLEDMGRLVRTLNGVIDHNKAHFGSTLAGVDLLVTQGAPRMIALIDEIDRVIRYTETRILKPDGALERIEAALASNLGQLTRQVSNSADQVARTTSRTLQSIEDPAQKTLEATRLGLAELRALIVEMHDLLAANRQAFGAMLGEMRDASEAVERVMLEVESNPSALIRGEPKKDGSQP